MIKEARIMMDSCLGYIVKIDLDSNLVSVALNYTSMPKGLLINKA